MTSVSRSSLNALLPLTTILADQGGGAVIDLEDDIDAVLVKVDDLRLDRGVVVAALGIHIQDVLAVGFGQRGGEHGARPQLHFRPQLVVGQLVVAFERHAVDDRIFDHAHHQRVAASAQPDILEQAGGIKRLEAAIEPVRVKPVARLDQQVGPDGAVLDALVALHLDRLDDAAVGAAGGRLDWRSRARCRWAGSCLALSGGGSDDQQWHQAGGNKPHSTDRQQKAGPPNGARISKTCTGHLTRCERRAP